MTFVAPLHPVLAASHDAFNQTLAEQAKILIAGNKPLLRRLTFATGLAKLVAGSQGFVENGLGGGTLLGCSVSSSFISFQSV